MTPELEEYFDNYNTLFAHPGYAQLCTDLEDKMRRLSDLSLIGSSDELFFRKGQIEEIKSILSLENTVGFTREELEYAEDI